VKDKRLSYQQNHTIFVLCSPNVHSAVKSRRVKWITHALLGKDVRKLHCFGGQTDGTTPKKCSTFTLNFVLQSKIRKGSEIYTT